MSSTEKSQLESQLLSAVESCQRKFDGRAELATELDPVVANLCVTFEKVLTHGLKSADSLPSVLRTNFQPSKTELVNLAALILELLFVGTTLKLSHVTELVTGGVEKYTLWDVIQSQLTAHEKERYELLRQIWTNRGRGRAWLRSAINERSLERYMTALIASPNVKTYYEDWAFVLDSTLNHLLPSSAAKLYSILFALSIDRPELNQASSGEDILKTSAISYSEAVIEDPNPGKREEVIKQKASYKKIISFGDEEIATLSPRPKPSSAASYATPVAQAEDDAGEIECAVEATGIEVDCSVIDRESKNVYRLSRSDSNLSAALRLLSNPTMGELIPVSSCEDNHSSEDSISVPSISEELDSSSTRSTVGAVEPGVEINDDTTANRQLRKKFEKLQEHNQAISSQWKSAELKFNEERSQLENKVHELQLENDSLKESLLKYISAVQMLKKDGTEFQGEDLFQQKLVQVAEMHAELMELNDRLQRNLVSKDVIIKRLYLELEAIRGPLGPSEIDISAEIISLWVPSVFMSGSPRPHHVYQIHIRIGSEEWNVYRRYSEFYELHQGSKKLYPVISTFQFPPKKSIGNKDTKFVEDRRLKLQLYLRRLVNYYVANHPHLSSRTSKASLTSSIPFFGESNDAPMTSSRNRFPNGANSPQYVGL